jgi:hypothetical protein
MMGVKIVRAITFFERLSLFRKKRHKFQFRPKEVFALIIVFARTVFPLFLFTPGAAWGYNKATLQAETCV